MTKMQSVKGIAIQTKASLWCLRKRINGWCTWNIKGEKWSSMRKLEKEAMARLCTFINHKRIRIWLKCIVGGLWELRYKGGFDPVSSFYSCRRYKRKFPSLMSFHVHIHLFTPQNLLSNLTLVHILPRTYYDFSDFLCEIKLFGPMEFHSHLQCILFCAQFLCRLSSYLTLSRTLNSMTNG